MTFCLQGNIFKNTFLRSIMGFLWSAGLVLGTAMAIGFLQHAMNPGAPMTELGGSVEPGWEKVADAFKKNMETGWELGAAFSVYHKGNKVVDIWGGYRDHEVASPWKEDTIGVYYSSTKGFAALMAAILVDRGHLHYEKSVATYWPNFAKHGKENITVKQLVSHQAGLVYLDRAITKKEYFDDDYMEKVLAEQKPIWEPGTAHGYHAFTFAMYVDQLIRHADPKKRNLVQFFKEEIKEPLGLDFYIGLPKEENYRVVRQNYMSMLNRDTLSKLLTPFTIKIMFLNMLDKEDILSKVLDNLPFYKHPRAFDDPDSREVPCASAAGFGTARSAAKLFGVVGNNGIYEGKKLLSSKTVQLIQTPLVSGTDKVFGLNLTFGYGFTPYKNPKGGFTIGTPGSGGQMAYADPQYKLGFAYVTSHMNMVTFGNDDPRYIALRDAMYECAEKA